jgi:RND family efflux transporter MFP subunit
VARITKGTPVVARIEALDSSVEGVVDVVVPAADPVSRTYELRARVPNAERRIRVGMSATLTLEVARHDKVIVVAQDTVVESEEERAIFVVKEGQARRRVVALGATEGSRVIITKGLEPGDEVITEGQRGLVDGQTIRVIKDEVEAHKGPSSEKASGAAPSASRS